jgi:hypothetical protein
LITRLSTVPGMVVRSVGSVRRYAGSDQDPLRAARELDVAWIVDGSLQRRGDQLRVTARLLRAADGGAVWSSSFDEKLTGVFDVQDLISARVAQALAPSLEVGAGARVPLTGIGGTRNTDAYQLYLAAGRYAQDLRADGLRKSLTLFNQALALDPGYALAWVGLAETHRRTLFGADGVPSEVFEPAHLAVQRALARTWPKPLPNRHSSSIGSTSIGPLPNANSVVRWQSIRMWLPRSSAWPCCCSRWAGPTKDLHTCARRVNSIRCRPCSI